MPEPKLKPLAQFVCDTCGGLIESPDQGYVEWVTDNGRNSAREFHIVHHALYSPLKPVRNCYQHKLGGCLALTDFLGADGLVEMLSFLDTGEILQPEYRGHHVADLREWVEFARRLFVPYYEEARRFWSRAAEAGHFEGANEVSPYISANLEALIRHYGDTT